MLNAIDVALFFLSLDSTGELFNKSLIERNGRVFYEGNARLNKYLHLIQNIYMAKTGDPLIKDCFYAYENGGIIPSIQERYADLLSRDLHINYIPDDIRDFLTRFYVAFKNASIDELIELSHEDSEWVQKHKYYDKQKQKMNPYTYLEEYRSQYSDIIRVLERMQL